MPRVIDLIDTSQTTPEECFEAIRAEGFDPRDETSLMHAARWLKRLGNNLTFLGDLLIDELKSRHRETDMTSAYGPQAIMLSDHAQGFFLRANIWPSEQDAALRASGGASFVYELPHDHNFDFLTVGYFGPGYWSEYYEYDYANVAGYVGEPVELTFVEKSQLEPGKLMHYRAHRDIHRQLPPESLSVSLNVMHASPALGWMDQYQFDLERSTIAGILGRGSSEAFLRIAVALGDEGARDLALQFGQNHPSDRMRVCAFDALANVSEDVSARDAIWRQAEGAGSLMLRKEAKHRRSALTLADA